MIENEDDACAWLNAQPFCDDVAMHRLDEFARLLMAENEEQNLVAAATLPAIWQRHIVDSAQLLSHVPHGTFDRWLDLGTGSGFPGIIVAILCPDREVLMVESRTRRVEWLNRACDVLELKNASVAGQRLELVPTSHADVISARAFAPLDKLLTLSSRFSTSETIWLLPKGRSAQQELSELRNWRHAFHVEQSLTDPEAGIIVGTLAGGKGKAK